MGLSEVTALVSNLNNQERRYLPLQTFPSCPRRRFFRSLLERAFAGVNKSAISSLRQSAKLFKQAGISKRSFQTQGSPWPLSPAPGPCQRRPRAAPRRTRWRSWSTTSTRSTSTRTPPRCASSRPRPASRRRRPRNGLNSAWPSGGSRKACPQSAGLLQTKEAAGTGSFPP